jgi:hypothetical protein
MFWSALRRSGERALAEGILTMTDLRTDIPIACTLHQCTTADDSSADWIESEGGGKVLNSVHVNRARLMIDTRKWLLSKMLPKIYGDHLTVAGDPDQPVQHIVHQIDWASLSDQEIEAIEMLARAVERRKQIEGPRPELGTDR